MGSCISYLRACSSASPSPPQSSLSPSLPPRAMEVEEYRNFACSSVSPSPPPPPPPFPSLPRQAMEVGEHRNWAELPPELTSSILLRLGATEVLQNAQKVCSSWHRVCKDPFMWRNIKIGNFGEWGKYDLDIMCRNAVDRSQGGLTSIDVWYIGTDDLLNYIADRSSNLRSLKLLVCRCLTDKGFVEAVVKLPLLEDLEISYCQLSGESVKVLGQSCPNLKTLKLTRIGGHTFPLIESDDDALAIAETMPGLRHLQLIGNKLTDVGVEAILEKCPNLEHLDLRKCFNVEFEGDLEERCHEKIKVVKGFNDTFLYFPYKDE